MQFNGSNIRSKCGMYVFGKIRIADKNSFTIEFVNVKQYAGIGIIDETYKKQSNLSGKTNIIRYDSDSDLFDGGQFKQKQGCGYKRGECVTVAVNTEESQIIFTVDG